ncbi:MAG: hypothetical protein CBB79_08445 [Synechococcus sp. TMED19]|nr:MAG: hypothetical protein CBB79_08445 [Synechococcus sp. TMED19]
MELAPGLALRLHAFLLVNKYPIDKQMFLPLTNQRLCRHPGQPPMPHLQQPVPQGQYSEPAQEWQG